MAKTNPDYWKERMAALENRQYQRSGAYYKEVQEQFRRASNNIQMDIEHWYQRLADNNGVSYAGAKRLLKKRELEEFKWSVGQYIKAGEENAVDQRWMKELENASARHHISYLEAMKLQIQQHAELLSAEYEGSMIDFLHKSYDDQYYHTAFEIANGTGVGSNLTSLDERKMDILLKKPWAMDGKNFSDRIWTNKQKLITNLHTDLTQSIIRGEAPQKAIDRLSKDMKVGKSQAANLIMTESAAISSRAQQDCFQELGVEEFEVIETLDGSTCEICQEMDGKHFPMSDYRVGETAPPFHPRCRGCTAPYFDDEFSALEKRAARNPETGEVYEVPADMSYPEWKRKYVEEETERNQKTEYLIRDNKVAEDTKKERQVFQEAFSSVPEKVRQRMEDTVVDVGKIGASQYDYSRDILYIAKGADKEEVIHEIGHMVENKMLDSDKISRIKRKIIGEVDIWDIQTETFYDNEDCPVEIYLLKNNSFVSEYQGRIYADTIWDAFDDEGNFLDELMMEFISEPFREFIFNPEGLRCKSKELYDLIQEAVR